MPRHNPITILLDVPYSTAVYLRETAINRFFDNIERALRGDKECKANLLAEDLADAREHYEALFRQAQSACNEELSKA